MPLSSFFTQLVSSSHHVSISLQVDHAKGHQSHSRSSSPVPVARPSRWMSDESSRSSSSTACSKPRHGQDEDDRHHHSAGCLVCPPSPPKRNTKGPETRWDELVDNHQVAEPAKIPRRR